MAAKRARIQARGEDEEEFEGFDNDDKKGEETDASSDADLIEDDEEDVESGDEDGKMMTELQQKEKK